MLTGVQLYTQTLTIIFVFNCWFPHNYEHFLTFDLQHLLEVANSNSDVIHPVLSLLSFESLCLRWCGHSQWTEGKERMYYTLFKL